MLKNLDSCTTQHLSAEPVRFIFESYSLIKSTTNPASIGLPQIHYMYLGKHIKLWVTRSWGHEAQSVTCLATGASLTADPGVASLIPARSDTFLEIGHEIFSMVIFLPSAESFKKGCCQLQAKVCARSTGQLLVKACPGKSVGR